MEYIHIDCSGLDDTSFAQRTREAVNHGLKRPDRSVRALVIARNTKITPNGMRIISAEGKKVQPKLKKSALVGSVGLFSVLAKMYIAYTGSPFKFFTDLDRALDYLVKDT